MPLCNRSKEKLELIPVILKLAEDSAIIEDAKTILSLKTDTYGVPIMLNRKERGMAFFGGGDYLINSQIKTNFGIFSKQYVDSFSDWGLIVGKEKNWSRARKHFSETEDVPKGFIYKGDFIKKARKEMQEIISHPDTSLRIENADWFYKVKGEKDVARLHYKEGRIVFRGCGAALVADEEKVVLKEGETALTLDGDKVTLHSDEGKLVTHEERIVSDNVVISDERAVAEGFIGKYKELVDKARFDSLALLPKALEKLGYKLE